MFYKITEKGIKYLGLGLSKLIKLKLFKLPLILFNKKIFFLI